MDSYQNKRGITPTSSSLESDAILSEIRHTRGRMDHTLDELGDKLQPRHLVEDAVDYFWTRERSMAGKAKESTAQMGRKVIDEVREHPLPALLIGAGVIWLLSQQHAKQRGEVGAPEEETSPGLKEKAQQAFQAAKDKLQQGKESFKERTSGVSDTAREKLGSAWEGTKEKSSQVKEKARSYYEQTSQTVKQTAETHPLALGVASLAAGLLAGVMAPRTRAEDRAFGGTADRIKDEAKHEAERIAQSAKEGVSGAREESSAQTQQEDLTPEGLTGRSEEFIRPGEFKAGPVL